MLSSSQDHVWTLIDDEGTAIKAYSYRAQLLRGRTVDQHPSRFHGEDSEAKSNPHNRCLFRTSDRRQSHGRQGRTE